MEPRSPGILPLAAGILGAGIGLMASCLNPDQTSHSPEDPSQPNVVLILADDMGYGDAGAFNAGSAIATPAIDTLAGEGLRFTDAHSPGAWCVPSRYGLLTGQAPWRVGRFHPDRGPVLGEDLLTLPGLLKERGYRTAMVGKWHLGFEGGPATAGEDKLGGPLDRGFDLFYGIHASLDIPPYYYIDGRTPVAPPSGKVEARSTEGWTPIQGEFWRAGDCAPGFVHAEVLPRFTERAVHWIEELAGDEAPFFLYLALASPHTPWFSSGRHDTGAGLYGAFVADTDAAIGEVLAALEREGVAGSTLVIVTSDNGPVWYPDDVERFGHSATGPYRGMKSDGYEGGHRMPFIARWPGRIPAGTETSRLTTFTDILPTLAELSGDPVAGTDGESFVTTLLDPAGQVQGERALVLKANASVVREGSWKLVNHLGSGGFTRPRKVEPEPGGPTVQLYDLASDPGETTNLWAEHPEMVERLLAIRAEQTGR